MKLSNEVVLRPRFKIAINQTNSEIIEKFKRIKSNPEGYKITSVDAHLFLRLPKNEQTFWSPQLHLELFELEENQSEIRGFFGPNPTIWTMFMFFHVAIGMLFLVDMVWLYSNINLNNPYGLQIGIGIGLILIWIALYIGGTVGKKKGKPGMQSLYGFMLRTIDVN